MGPEKYVLADGKAVSGFDFYALVFAAAKPPAYLHEYYSEEFSLTLEEAAENKAAGYDNG